LFWAVAGETVTVLVSEFQSGIGESFMQRKEKPVDLDGGLRRLVSLKKDGGECGNK